MRQNGAFGIRRGAADTEAFRLAKRVLDEGRVLGAHLEAAEAALAERDIEDALAHGEAAVKLDRFAERAHRTIHLDKGLLREDAA
jgi:hypothetical protein